jgi:acetyltransferase-like isoleucine patch superfamily enzyme
MLFYLKRVYLVIGNLKIGVFTRFICFFYGLAYDNTWQFIGKPIIHLPYFIHKNRKQALKIGKNLKLISKFDSNSIGLIQPVFINARSKDCKIIIGNNVGISGATISAAKLIQIGDNVLIGSGCLIMDNDAHNIHPSIRHDKMTDGAIRPVIIENNVFIGARSIILKGVTIGEGAVIGAGSVVSRDVPKNSICAGNPAKVIRENIHL